MIGYVVASVILLLGIMIAGIVYLQQKEFIKALVTTMPFILVAIPIYVYLGLTQESSYEYGMNKKRALVYSIATDLLLFGLFLAGILFLKGNELYIVISALMPFLVISIAIFIYLGLTEKNRLKMGPEWKNQWVQYYTNPQTSMVRGNISGALWIFSIAIFFIIGFGWSWKYSWIVFIVAVGFEILIEAYFASKRKNS